MIVSSTFMKFSSEVRFSPFSFPLQYSILILVDLPNLEKLYCSDCAFYGDASEDRKMHKRAPFNFKNKLVMECRMVGRMAGVMTRSSITTILIA